MGGFLEIPEVKPRESPVGFLAPFYETPRWPGEGNLAALRGCRGCIHCQHCNQ
jgi:hypothetical protein